jgi:hypothetical protein
MEVIKITSTGMTRTITILQDEVPRSVSISVSKTLPRNVGNIRQTTRHIPEYHIFLKTN